MEKGRALPKLFCITQRTLSEVPLPARIAEVLSEVGGDDVAVQLREKDLPVGELLELGRAILPLCRSRGVRLLVNGAVEVALQLGADGVHLGGQSMSAVEARRLLGPKALIGVSCHTVEELRSRLPGADYATWSPLFSPISKTTTRSVASARAAIEPALACGLPLVGLGGVTAERAPWVRRWGLSGIAAIGAIFAAPACGWAARALLKAFQNAPSS